jgi:hypothetical protein
MFYSTNQSYHWKLNQSEVAISGRLANQKPGKKNWLVVQNVGWGVFSTTSASYNLLRTSSFYWLSALYPPFSYIIVYIYTFYELALIISCPFPAILFSLSTSYNLIIFYELALLLVICPFHAILFSLSASYNLIIFYELALSLVICPFPAILFS